ncbi:primary-amine oxidase [Roseivivax marinus]|uniref:copper amine oxidase n=1 Tax=Roseivivax marinus TaxID=1379903 RepID=UPI0008CB35F5|nr:tyramine oxidase [Roseivivax marinus]SEK62773.1 primary-amine oxidase [Roseivivax marinus]
MKRLLSTVAAGLVLGTPLYAQTHPLDGLTSDEYDSVVSILRDADVVSEATLFPLIELQEPPKAEVLAWDGESQIARKALVHYTSTAGFGEAIVNITSGEVEESGLIDEQGQPMIMLTEFMGALQAALSDERMIEALAKRDLTPDQTFCLPLTAGNFLTPEYEGNRLMKIPCYVVPEGSNFYAKPIEGLSATYDLSTNTITEVTDTGVVDVPEDPWGYTEEEIDARVGLRPESNRARLSREGETNVTFDGSELTWDIWKMRLRVDKRPGLVVSDIRADDQGTWRDIIYQAHLSEVFVPYMDPDENWYWRTYMDSGEYGFGLFLTPLTAGVDCPDYATFLPAVVNDDSGAAMEIPDAICIFERSKGDPAWRHFEVFAQSEDQFVPAEGRPHTELVVRTASEVGNYDYLIDYRFHQDGQMQIMVGATGLDAVKGVNSTSMSDEGAEADTDHGTLIAPNLVAANHDHYFNFRIDFDIDQPKNTFMTMNIVPAEVSDDSPRRSMWEVQENVPQSEAEASYQISAMKPRYFMMMNQDRKGYLDHTPGWMIHHGSIAYGPFDFANDPPFARNPWIENSVWNTVQKDNERYAGGSYAMQSDGSETLATYVEDDEPLPGQDVVTWFTAGFHHIPRMEDWPVMSTEWKQVHIMPHNFFAMNPAISLRK